MHNYLVVYGTLKAGHERHHVIAEDTVFVDEIALAGSLHNFKNAYPAWDWNGPGMISAEIYRIIDNHKALIKELDAIEGHPHLFTRQEVELEIAIDHGDLELFDQVEDGFVVFTAYIYKAEAPFLLQSPMIPSGVWPLDKALLETV